MLGTFGFSYVGLIYLLMITVPNAIWAKNQPPDYDPGGENRVLLVFERVGQALVTGCALLFTDYNLRPFDAWSMWLVASFALMLIYELFWIRYFCGGHTMRDFYRSLWGIPVPGASLPVAAFLLLGIYGRVILMIIAIVILGIGHIGIHIGYVRKL